MNIHFVLPGKPAPIGGFKVVYGHAKVLKDAGHDVTVFHTNHAILSSKNFSRIFLSLIYLFRSITNKWQRYPQQYGLSSYTTCRQIDHSSADLVVISSWQLIKVYTQLKFVPRNKLCHLAMDFPDYMGPAKEVIDSWQHDLNYVAISRHLERTIRKVIRPGATLNYFPACVGYKPRIKNSIDKKELIICCVSSGTYKNQTNLIELLNSLSSEFEIATYSREKKPTELDLKISHYRNLTDEQINTLFQKAKYAISYSTFEGFGLPAFEAALNGCLVFSTKFLGNEDYWTDNNFTELSGTEVADDIITIKSAIFQNRKEQRWHVNGLPFKDFLHRYSDHHLVKLYEGITHEN